MTEEEIYDKFGLLTEAGFAKGLNMQSSINGLTKTMTKFSECYYVEFDQEGQRKQVRYSLTEFADALKFYKRVKLS